jgi:predicted membrane-bound mannosyltransferase
VNFAVSDLAIRFWSNSDSALFFYFPFYCGGFTLIAYNRIGGVMVSVLATHVVDHGFQ